MQSMYAILTWPMLLTCFQEGSQSLREILWGTQTMQAVALRCSLRDLLCHILTILRENCPNSEFSWSKFSRIRTEYGDLKKEISKSPYSTRTEENIDQKTPNWTLYTHWKFSRKYPWRTCFYEPFFGFRQSFREQLFFWHRLNMCFWTGVMYLL